MANGFNISTDGHPILILPPQLINGTVAAQAFSLANAEHASICLAIGATPSPPQAPLSIVLNACTSAAGANPTPLQSFRFYYQSTPGAGHDILDGTSGIPYPYTTPPNYSGYPEGITVFLDWGPNIQYWFEVDAAELEAAAGFVGPVVAFSYLQVVINQLANTYCAIVAILSGERYGGNLQASATV